MNTLAKRSFTALSITVVLASLILALNITIVSANSYSPLLTKTKAPAVWKITPIELDPDTIDKDSVEFTVIMNDASTIDIDVIQVVVRQDGIYLVLDVQDLQTVNSEDAFKTQAIGTLNNGADDFFATGPAPAWRWSW